MSAETERRIIEDPELQKDVCKAYLERESLVWLGHKALAERAGGLSAKHNTDRDKAMKVIDAMLEELIEIPGVRYESGV